MDQNNQVKISNICCVIESRLATIQDYIDRYETQEHDVVQAVQKIKRQVERIRTITERDGKI